MPEIKHIGPLIKMLSNAVEQKINTDVQKMDLTSAQMFILHFICRNNDKGICQKDIEAEFELTHATVSGIIARLESKGFVECVNNGEDKRKKSIRATEKAFLCDCKIKKSIDETEAQLLKGLSDSQKEFLCSILFQMLENTGVDISARAQKGRMKKC